jgi:hypothetical protein
MTPLDAICPVCGTPGRLRSGDEGMSSSADAARAILDWSYGKRPTYDLPGHCLTCGAAFTVRREKGVKPPLSVVCPDCECTEYSWMIYQIEVDAGRAAALRAYRAEPLDVDRLAGALHRAGVSVPRGSGPEWYALAAAAIAPQYDALTYEALREGGSPT